MEELDVPRELGIIAQLEAWIKAWIASHPLQG
jgi:hypothetical protein